MLLFCVALMGADFGSPVPLEQRVSALEARVTALESSKSAAAPASCQCGPNCPCCAACPGKQAAANTVEGVLGLTGSRSDNRGWLTFNGETKQYLFDPSVEITGEKYSASYEVLRRGSHYLGGSTVRLTIDPMRYGLVSKIEFLGSAGKQEAAATTPWTEFGWSQPVNTGPYPTDRIFTINGNIYQSSDGRALVRLPDNLFNMGSDFYRLQELQKSSASQATVPLQQQFAPAPMMFMGEGGGSCANGQCGGSSSGRRGLFGRRR